MLECVLHRMCSLVTLVWVHMRACLQNNRLKSCTGAHFLTKKNIFSYLFSFSRMRPESFSAQVLTCTCTCVCACVRMCVGTDGHI
jgi:hypothetical protein